ncbi:MAG: hypothetical protein HC868_02785 [Sphingomonadales bacterium]|nr:hypothetical protein [Sphingomonadales bacterium]
MLSTVELAMTSFVIVLLPLTVYSMITRALPPQTTWLGKIYAADTRLLLVSNLFLLAVCLSSLVRLAIHFRLVGTPLQTPLEIVVGVPFFILLVIFLAMLVRAGLKVRRAAGTST